MFGDINAHHMKWLNPSNVTDVTDSQTNNFSVVQSFIHIVSFLTRFLNNYDQYTSLLDLFLISPPGSCQALQLSPLGN